MNHGHRLIKSQISFEREARLVEDAATLLFCSFIDLLPTLLHDILHIPSHIFDRAQQWSYIEPFLQLISAFLLRNHIMGQGPIRGRVTELTPSWTTDSGLPLHQSLRRATSLAAS